MTLLDPRPLLVADTAFGLNVYSHSVFFALGAIVAATILSFSLFRDGEKFSVGLERSLWIFLIGLFGGRVGYLLVYLDQWDHPGQLFSIWEGGLISYFGIAAGLLTAWWFVRTKTKAQRLRWYDQVTLATLWGWAIGRLGNYYAAESFGVASERWSAFYGRVPIQLFESALCIVIAVLLYSIARKKQPGFVLNTALFLYFTGRFIIDFWRDETIFIGLHVSQWLSLLLMLTLLTLQFKLRQAHD